MKATLKQPTSLIEAVTFFADESRAFDTMIARRWPNGLKCPVCGSASIRFMEARRFWNCNGCRKQFSLKTGTIFEASPMSIGKWLTAMWLIVNAKNGISSCEIARSLGITQKSAWFMAHRIRLALANGTFEKLGGHVEADETYVGGKAKNMLKNPKQEVHSLGGGMGKTIVMGFLERGGYAKDAGYHPNRHTDDSGPRRSSRREGFVPLHGRTGFLPGHDRSLQVVRY